MGEKGKYAKNKRKFVTITIIDIYKKLKDPDSPGTTLLFGAALCCEFNGK